MIEVGIVTDLTNYKEYYSKFSKESKNNIIEIHLLEKDLDKNFENKLIELRHFYLTNRIKHIAFHSIDHIMQSVLYKEEGFEKNLEIYNILIDGIIKFSNEIKEDVILVVHQGSKFSRENIEKLTLEEMKLFRNGLHEKAKIGFQRIKKDVENSYVKIALENSPPTCASDTKDHVFDLCFEDFQERLGNGGYFVFDFSHASLCIEYFKQEKIKFNSLEVLRDENGKPPYSLQSLENYIEVAGKNIKWMHINDADGILGENEGKEIGIKDSNINFKSVLKKINKYVSNPKGVLEVINSHKDYSLISNSLKRLKEFEFIKIGGKIISDGNCFIIAEVASSHCGDKEKLKTIIKGAVEAKADAIKFQLYSAEGLYSKYHPGLEDGKKIVLTKEEWKEILEYTKQFDISILTDVFEEDYSDLAEPYVDAFSIHASDISNPFLLKHVAKKEKPVLLYVGGSTLDEIDRAIKCVQEFETDIILVYGLQNFPTKVKNVNLKRIKTLKDKFNLPICYHDHTDAETSLATNISTHAFAYGAQLIEKHITDDRSLEGFDYMSSLNPNEFKEMVEKVREFEKIIGTGKFKLTIADQEYRKKMKKFIVAKKDIEEGELITLDNITFKRVQNGQFHPNEFEQIIGKKSKTKILEEAPILNENIVHKVAILIPVRMKSIRLPKKAILEISGDTTIGHMIERLKNSNEAEIILCTSNLEEDSCLIEIAKEKGIKWFAGDPDDVMVRFINAAERENVSIVVRATGDNPLMDPELIDRQIKYHIKNKADYTGVEEVPIGFNAEIVNLDVIKKARSFVKDPKDTEYMTWFIKDPKNFKVIVMPIEDQEEKGDYRLTLDTPEDFEVIKEVFNNLYQKNKIFTLKETVNFLDNNPSVSEINNSYKQIKLPPNLEDLNKKDISFENAK